MVYSFDKNVSDLPKTLPIFPLSNVLLLPRSKLPLNLFENRYLHMFDYALSNGRAIGMVQPKTVKALKNSERNPTIYSIGCAGYITAFTETNDNRSYHVSSNKIKDIINFEATHTIKDAVKDLKEAFENNKLPNSLKDSKYFNIKKMQEINLN